MSSITCRAEPGGLRPAGAQISSSEIKDANYSGPVVHDGKALIYFYDLGESCGLWLWTPFFYFYCSSYCSHFFISVILIHLDAF